MKFEVPKVNVSPCPVKSMFVFLFNRDSLRHLQFVQGWLYAPSFFKIGPRLRRIHTLGTSNLALNTVMNVDSIVLWAVKLKNKSAAQKKNLPKSHKT